MAFVTPSLIHVGVKLVSLLSVNEILPSFISNQLRFIFVFHQYLDNNQSLNIFNFNILNEWLFFCSGDIIVIGIIQSGIAVFSLFHLPTNSENWWGVVRVDTLYNIFTCLYCPMKRKIININIQLLSGCKVQKCLNLKQCSYLYKNIVKSHMYIWWCFVFWEPLLYLDLSVRST